MPQLDLLTWISQVFFFSISSFVFYALLKLLFMPTMFGLIKMQSKLIKFSLNIIPLRNKLSQMFCVNFIQHYLMQGLLNLIPLKMYLIKSTGAEYAVWVHQATSILADITILLARKKIIRIKL